MAVTSVGWLKCVSHPVICSAVLSQTKNRPCCSCTATCVLVVVLAEMTELSLSCHRAPRAVLRTQHPIQVLSLPEKGQPNPVGLPGRKFPVLLHFVSPRRCLRALLCALPVLSQPPALATMHTGRADGPGAAAESLPRVVCTQAGGACGQPGLRSKRGCLLGAEEVLVADGVLQKQVTRTYIAQAPACFPRAAAAAWGGTLWKQKCSKHCLSQNFVFTPYFKTYLTAWHVWHRC